MYWENPRQPRILPLLDESPDLVQLSRIWLEQNGSFRIALCPLRSRLAPQFQIIEKPGEKQKFFACCPEGLQDSKGLEEHLRLLFADAAAERINVLVFPELSIDKPTRRLLSRLLREQPEDSPLLAVIGGSFHIWTRREEQADAWEDEEEEEKNEKQGLPVNEAVVLDSDGRVFWRHRKRGYFEVKRDLVHCNPAFFPIRPDIVEEIVEEGILPGNMLRVLETPLGRLAILICADAIERSPNGYDRVIEEVHPDLLFVVAMSLETKRFEEFVNRMKDQGIGTLFVNAACAGGDESCLALVDLALWQNPGDPPTKLQWHAHREPEWYDYHQADRDQRWKPLQQQATPTFAALPDRRGVVVDLGRLR